MKKVRKKSRSRLYNPHDGSTKPATQVHKSKVKYDRNRFKFKFEEE